jgi:hypothetical protein
MSEDRIGATDPNQQTLPKKRGRKPKVIMDPSDPTQQITKTPSLKGVEPQPPKVVEVPEKVI